MMAEKIAFIGITQDSVAWVTPESSGFRTLPVIDTQDFYRRKSIISRVRSMDLLGILAPLPAEYVTRAIIERPASSMPFSRHVGTVRRLEAVLVVLELLTIPYEFVDKAGWERTMLPRGLKPGAPTRLASMDIGKRLFPQHTDTINSIGHADALLLAEFYRHACNLGLKEVEE